MVDSQKKYSRWCFVPLCSNTEKNKPDKIFIHVPKNAEMRQKWFAAANRKDKPTKSSYYCCEDHFDLPNDMDNYIHYQLIKCRIKMRDNVVPHIFECQPKRAATKRTIPRSLVNKLQRKRKNSSDNSLNDITGEESLPKIFKTSDLTNLNDREELPEDQLDYELSPRINKATNTVRCHFRSKGVSVKPTTADFGCLVHPYMVDKLCSPPKSPMKSPNAIPPKFRSDTNCESSSSKSSITRSNSDHSEYQPSNEDFLSEDFNIDSEEEYEREMKTKAAFITNYLISRDPKNYIGVPKKWLWILEELSGVGYIPLDHIKLILMKIKTKDTFRRLADQFGLSESGASKVFNRHVANIAHILKPLIYFPEKISLQKLLPIPFRLNFSNVAATIDCFEIQIEKPSNSVHQALTWSEYKKCNTLKILICISPDGLITYISDAYGGRISDVELFSICGIMDILPENSDLMVDRGFKQIQTILQNKNIRHLRPPSVLANAKMSREEVILTKRIASLRIHIERVIRRLREFSLLEPHSTLDHNIMPYINSVVKIAAALVNLQDPVIKT